MSRRQSVPEQWFIVDRKPDQRIWAVITRLPRHSGILLLRKLGTSEQRRLRHLATLRCLEVVAEPTSARVHNSRELRRALLRRTPLLLISPLYPTQSHPDWRPLPRMRAASFARLAGRKAIALGAMDQARFGQIRQLGFVGWAGIGAWLNDARQSWRSAAARRIRT